MRDDLLFTDLPVALPQGTKVAEPASGGLHFNRSYRATLKTINELWTDHLMRQHWLAPLKSSRFAITLAAPAYLEAEESDGIHAVRMAIFFEDDGELTTMRIRITPVPPITMAILIDSGYADHWEERLNSLTDHLPADAWEP